MVKSNTIDLIAVTYTQDSYGVMRPTEESTTVFCEVNSVTQTEFFNGGASGFKPEYRFTVFSYDYSNQKELEFNGVRYVVYRTYIGKFDNIELYCERKTGASSE